jgi:hypothetical protein
MSEFHLALTEDERLVLQRVLERALKETQIEEHRTDALTYKQMVQQEESTLERLLQKVQVLASSGALV